MPIRGKRSIWPKKPRKPTGIFSTNGRQKNDGDGGAPNKSTMQYAHRNTPTCKVPKGGEGLRHQKPAAGKSTRLKLPT